VGPASTPGVAEFDDELHPAAAATPASPAAAQKKITP
jgi:hypothetical protein